MRKYFLPIFILFTAFYSKAQRSFFHRGEFKDSCYHIVVVGVHLSGELPYGDMQNRFGSNFNVGMPIFYKTSKNLILGVEGNYLFGGNVRENPLDYMYTAPINKNNNIVKQHT